MASTVGVCDGLDTGLGAPNSTPKPGYTSDSSEFTSPAQAHEFVRHRGARREDHNADSSADEEVPEARPRRFYDHTSQLQRVSAGSHTHTLEQPYADKSALSGLQLDPPAWPGATRPARPSPVTSRRSSTQRVQSTNDSNRNSKRTSSSSLQFRAGDDIRPASRRVPSTDSFASTAPSTTSAGSSGSRRPFLVPRSALRTDDCFGLDFSFLSEEPPSRSSYTSTFATGNLRRGSVEQSRARRPASIASDKTATRSPRHGDSFKRSGSNKPSSLRATSSAASLPFPSRPRPARTVSKDSVHETDLASAVSPASSHAALPSPPLVGDVRRASAVSSMSFTSTASSCTSGFFSGARSRNLSSDLDVEGTSGELPQATLAESGPEAIEKRKRLVEFLDQTAEAMEGGKSLAMVLPETKATESEPAKTMSQLAEAAPLRTPAQIEYRHPFAAMPVVGCEQEDTTRSPKDNGLLGAQFDSLKTASPSTPRADPKRHSPLNSEDPRISVYFTPDPSDKEENMENSEAQGSGPAEAVTSGGLGFKFDIKSSLIAPDRSPSTVRANSPASFRQPIQDDTPSPPAKDQGNNELPSPVAAIPDDVAQEMERRAKMADKRKRTISELIETEATYASDMVIVREIYLARAKGADIGSIADRVMASGLGLSHSAAASPPSPLPNRPGSSLSFGQSSAGSARAIDLRRATLVDARRKSMTPSFQSKLDKRRATLALQEPTAKMGRPVMSPKDLHVVFANLEEVSQFAELFAEVLATAKGSEDPDEMDDQIGQVFCEMIPRIEKIYSTYCSRHDRAINRLQELEPEIKAYLTDCRALSSGRTQAWDLGSLLIKPVQRALKYPLLLDQILALTPEDHPDRHDLLRANEMILGVAEHINEQKQRYRPMDRVKREVKKEVNARRESTKSISSAVTKKFLRSSVSKPKQPSTTEQSERDDMFDTLAHLVDSTRSSVLRFSNEMRDWSRSTKAQLEAQVTLVDGWIQMYAPLQGEEESPLYQRLVIFLEEVLDPIIDGPWRELDYEIRKSLLLKTDHLLSLFESPRQFIAKRNDKMLDHSRYLAKKLSADRRGSEEFLDLSNRLLEELPRFLNSVSRYYDIIAGHFAGAQEAYQEAVQERWQAFADEYLPANNCTEVTSSQQQAVMDMMHRLAIGLGTASNCTSLRHFVIDPKLNSRSTAAISVPILTRRRQSQATQTNKADTSRRASLNGAPTNRPSSIMSVKGRSLNRVSMTTNRSSINSDSSTPSFGISSNSGASSIGGPTTPPAAVSSRPSSKGFSPAHRRTFSSGGRFDHPLPQLPIQEVNSSESEASNSRRYHTPPVSRASINGYDSSDLENVGNLATSARPRPSSQQSAPTRPPLGRNNYTDGSNSSLSDGRYLARYTEYLEAGDKFDFSSDQNDEDDVDEEFEHYERLYTAQAMHSSTSKVSPGFRSGFPIHAFQIGDRIDVVLEEADRAEGGAGWLLGRKCEDGTLGWVRTEWFHLEEEDDEEVEFM
ncbi:hypothetical protein OIV83_004941 [Microbotryomycetes sp. JL201]|nr:hypothetical protein OIV83_004941 [Microbotryomycetes sp. JL201]